MMRTRLASPETLQEAAIYLTTHDSHLASVIDQIGICTIRPHTNYYQELVESILGQQLSLQAAAAIELRFMALFEGNFPTPIQIALQDADSLRAAGLSRAKVVYIQDLARCILNGTIHFDHLDGLSNTSITTELSAVKGIGDWTVHMFLIFCMGRLDVLPTGDLGIKNGIRRLYNLASQPVARDIIDIAKANHWHPYESVASWYVWQSLKLPLVATTRP